MITDKQMIDLGFEKRKRINYKRKDGVSIYYWSIKNCFELSIEKNLGADFGDEYFMPTFRHTRMIINFTEIKQVKKLLKSINIYED